MIGRTCSHPDCDRSVYGQGLCSGHHARIRDGSTKTGPLNAAEVLVDEPHMPCPETLLPLANWCAENDARAILRLIWPHLLEASLAGVEPFTLEAAS